MHGLFPQVSTAAIPARDLRRAHTPVPSSRAAEGMRQSEEGISLRPLWDSGTWTDRWKARQKTTVPRPVSSHHDTTADKVRLFCSPQAACCLSRELNSLRSAWDRRWGLWASRGGYPDRLSGFLRLSCPVVVGNTDRRCSTRQPGHGRRVSHGPVPRPRFIYS